MPDASPVVVRVGGEKLRGQIVAIQGMTVTLGIERDFGPAIARVEISADPAVILERILLRMEDPASPGLPDRLARAAFGFSTTTHSPADFSSTVDLDPEQRSAVGQAIGSDILFIWGPPGTGKTQTLAALCEVLVEAGESVLLTSHTNVAVDEAMLRAAGPAPVGRDSGPLYQTPPYFEGKLLRVGEPKHQDLQAIKELSAHEVAERAVKELKDRLADVERKLDVIRRARATVQADLVAWEEVDRAEAMARAKRGAHKGALVALEKRRGEHSVASSELERSKRELDEVSNPRGLRRIFRKDPRPFRFTVGQNQRRLSVAVEAVTSANDREQRARASLEVAEAKTTGQRPSMPRSDLIQRAEWLDADARTLEQEKALLQREVDEVIERIIREAVFVATTLTKAAIDELLAKRTFDTVIIDEASMAPLPLVYLLALAAKRRVVLVGDFRQLGPIVQAPKSSELAHKWLGRDIFTLAGVDQIDLPPDQAALRADLLSQHRMAPQISAFASKTFYRSKLIDAEGERDDDRQWARHTPAGSQVCFVDTSRLGAWSQRSPGARPSKFNIYSALVATELAAILAEPIRRDEDDTGPGPVGIITPYRAQADLLKVLLKQRNLERLVHAGTVHSFQGMENQVIILDFVEDGPYWKAGPLLLGDSGDRLINVAVTRARHRLFVLGSYQHVQKHLKRSKLWDLAQYARAAQSLEAEEFLKADFNRAVAEAHARIRHGVVSDLDVDHLRVLSEIDFFSVLDYDLARAEARVVIFAPFLGQRAMDVIPRLAACIEAGVDVYMVTPPLADIEEGIRQFYSSIHQQLDELGVKLVFYRAMHQKLVFIDEHILYVGSLNPLSQRDLAETMDRWDSKDVFQVHWDHTGNDNILSMWTDPADIAMRTCPRHGTPLLVVSPAKYYDYDSMFWGCTNHPDCDYKRSFSVGPRRTGARLCGKCDAEMSLEQKPAGVWWVCGQCRSRRKVQEGEASKAQLAGRRSRSRRLSR